MRVSIVGAGTWGTALAWLAFRCGHSVRLWAREPEVVDSIENRRFNPLFLSDLQLPNGLFITGDSSEAIRDADVVVIAVPSQHLRRVLEDIAPHVTSDMFFVSATKGLEEETCLRMSEVITRVLAPRRIQARVVAISGPTFAREVVQERPTALVAASTDTDLAQKVQSELSTMNFRIYTNEDIIGVELGGAVKNVIAIAAGVGAGLEIGHNPLAALVTRGLAEMSRLCVALGGKRETLSGLAGMGDLLLTCTGQLSRNRTVGYELGRGKTLREIVSSMRMIAEGLSTTRATVALARKYNVDMPITFQMDRLLRSETTPVEAIRELMSRPLRDE
jgi:glycerol-3-phosphate dehydrogenase (NAD(P)+)